MLRMCEEGGKKLCRFVMDRESDDQAEEIESVSEQSGRVKLSAPMIGNQGRVVPISSGLDGLGCGETQWVLIRSMGVPAARPSL